MSLGLVVVAGAAALALAYRSYGALVARRLGLSAGRVTPAVELEDGVDFVPTPRFYLLGQHFSAIAAAGPIAGPILAGQQFGWLPCVLWIGLGVILIGAVHDLSVLTASVRHRGSTVAEVVRAHLGPRAWVVFSVFVWVALVYVIVAFCDITAQTFVSGDAELAGLAFRFNPGGAVALASTSYLVLAVVMGLVTRWLRPPMWATTLVFVPATLGCVWLGTEHSTLLVLSGAAAAKVWALGILAYCLVASLTPVWLLLQPRGYLGGFVLYLALGAALVGMTVGDFTIELPAFTSFRQPGATGLLFPFLFVTIACGACSGFHGLVCSGTTSKQIKEEPDCRPIGYGGMLLEALVALIALGTLMIASPVDLAGKAPGAIYGEGLGRFVTAIVGEQHLAIAVTFGAMAFSTFVFDTLDVSTRLGRYILQELFGLGGRAGALAATAVTCVVPAAFIVLSGTNAYRAFWTLFGTSNQLLAALSLLAVTVWLRRAGRSSWFTALPMLFMFAVTFTSLALVVANAQAGAGAVGEINATVAFVLLALAGSLLAIGATKLLRSPEPLVEPPVDAGTPPRAPAAR